jgi:hypothetical protein
MEDEKTSVIHEILEKRGILDKLLDKLENHINEIKFKEEIDKHVRSLFVNKNLEDISANEIYNILYDFISENLPSQVQELMFHDIRTVVDENLEDFKELSK